MEKEIHINTEDGHIIYGTLNSTPKKNKKLIILVPGISGHIHGHALTAAAKFFPQRGYDTYRFYLYSNKKKGRKRVETGIKKSSKDVNAVISFFQDQYDSIYLLGQSLGGPIVGTADLTLVEAVVLLDPAIPLPGVSPDLALKGIYSYDKKLDKHFLFGYEMPAETSLEMLEMDERLARKLIKPTLLVFAGKFVFKDFWKSLNQEIPAFHDFITLGRAGHSFAEEGMTDQVNQASLKWFNKY